MDLRRLNLKGAENLSKAAAPLAVFLGIYLIGWRLCLLEKTVTNK